MQILHLEDSPADSEFIRRLLTRHWPQCKIELVGKRAEYTRFIEVGRFDLILSDYSMPSFTGLDALRLAQQFQFDTPFIFCSGTIGEDRAIEAMRSGATDYVLKDNLNRLVPAVQRALQELVERRKRRDAESALRRSESRYRALISATAEIVWTSNAAGSKLNAEPPWHEFTGVTESQIQNGGWLETIHPDDRLAVAEAWSGALASKKKYEIEFRVLRADGAWRSMVTRAVAQFTDSGQVEEWIGVCFDITAQRQAEESGRRLLGLLEGTTDFVVIASANGEVLYANPASQRVLGMDSSTEDSLHFLQDYYSPGWRERLIKEFMVDAARDGSWSGEAGLVDRNGTLIPISQVLIAPKSGDGKPSHFATIMRDISSAKEAQRKLREQAEVITQARDAVIITDLQGKIVFWNQGAERLYGWKEDEIVGHNAEQFFEPYVMEQRAEARREALQTGSWSGEIRMHDRELKPLFVEVRVSLVREENGVPKAFLNIATDITEKKNLEEQFLRAQRLENLGLLASGISHDLNNILTPILMAAPLLLSRLSDAEDINLIQILDKSAQRGAEMVQQILSFARGAGGEFRPIQIRSLLADVVRIGESTFPKSIAIRHLFSSDLPVVRANSTQIHQLLLNLCVNARDAMPEGGTLWLRAENRSLAEPTSFVASVAPPGDYVVIEVGDTGTGIPPEVLARMWEPFYSTKGKKGTGLGLSTVLGIVQDHHGFVEVQTEKEKGTTFRVFFPVVGRAEGKPGTANPFMPEEGGNETILVADDEANLRAMLGTALSVHGYHPIIASSASDAIELASRHRESIRLFITDVSMPDMDGARLAGLVRECVPSVKILVISGDADAEQFGDRFLVKPFKPSKLLHLIHEMLHPQSVERSSEE